MTHLLERDHRVVWHPYTVMPHQGPREAFVRAEGSYVYTESGRKLFDGTSSWWCQLHGHCHPRLIDSLITQAKQMDQVLFAPHTHEAAVKFCDALLRHLPGFQRVFLSDDGSTAVESGLKIAAQYFRNIGKPKKRKFVSLTGGYHGDTLGAVSVGYIPEFHESLSEVLTPSLKVPQPYCYRCPVDKTYPSCDIACLSEARKLVSDHSDEIAAVIVEPLVMGAAGMVVYPHAYIHQLIQLCREREILIIFDEVFTGFGRTGTMFAYHQLTEAPDIICLSKGITSGMLPLGATVVPEKIFEAFCGSAERRFSHGHTYSGNPLGCAVATESLKLFAENNVLFQNERLIEIFQRATSRFVDLPAVGDVRHLGMIFAIEIVEDRKTKRVSEPRNRLSWKVCESLWNEGLWLRPMGNVVYLVPPYSTTPSELEDNVQLLYRSMCELSEYTF